MVLASLQPLPRMTWAALPVKAAKTTSPVTLFGDVAGERRLAGAGIAEQAKHLRSPAFSQAATAVSALVLLGRPLHQASV